MARPVTDKRTQACKIEQAPPRDARRLTHDRAGAPNANDSYCNALPHGRRFALRGSASLVGVFGHEVTTGETVPGELLGG